MSCISPFTKKSRQKNRLDWFRSDMPNLCKACQICGLWRVAFLVEKNDSKCWSMLEMSTRNDKHDCLRLHNFW